MRPLRLVLQGFGPFPDRVEVDFERLAAHGLFLIQGHTGAGKSTLLDGMTFALYGETKGEKGPERGGADFVTTLTPPERVGAGERTRVEFEFMVGGDRYRVTRYPAQKVARARGDGGAPVQKAPEARLERLDAAGAVAETIAEKVGDVTQAVVARLGCSVEQFRQTVVLPQGEFRDVVTDEKARRAVLERIFDTHRFADLTRRLKVRAQELQQQGRLEQDARQRILAEAGVERPDGLRAQHVAAGAARDLARVRRDTAQVGRDRAVATLAEGRTAAEAFHELAELEAASAEIDAEGPAQARRTERLALARRAQELHPTLARHERAEAERGRAADELAKAEGLMQATADALAAAGERLAAEAAREPERIERQALAARLDALAPDVAELASQGAQLQELRTRLEARRARAEGLAVARAALVDEREARTAERGDLEPTAAGHDAAHAALAAARRCAEALRDVEALEGRIADAAAGIAALAAGSSGTDADALIGVLRHHAAGLVAAGLRAGEACPACGSDHHPAPHAPADLAVLKGALDAVQVQQDRMARLQGKHDELGAQCAAALAAEGWTEARPTAAALAQAFEEAQAALNAAAAARARIATIDARLAELQRETGSLDADAGTIAVAIAQDETKAAGVHAAITRTLQRLPEDAREPTAFAAHRAEASAASRAAVDAWERAREEHRRTQSDHAQAGTRVEERRARLADARREESDAAAALVAELARLGFPDAAAAGAARLEHDEMASLGAAIADHAERKSRVNHQIGELRSRLAGRTPPDLPTLEAAVADAEAAWTAADTAHRATDRDHEHLARLVTELQRADDALRQLEARQAAATKLARIAAGEVPGRPKIDLETFVLQRQFNQVLHVGNVHLQRMTRGRYTLHLVHDTTRASDTGLDLEIADHHADGVRRPAKTLSGGEGFLAALALALGLSDTAQRSKYPIQALFIDEGFGSLDQASLDQVTRMLRDLPNIAGRMVGIISHVEDLKRLIPVQLVVMPTGRGSRLELRVNEW